MLIKNNRFAGGEIKDTTFMKGRIVVYAFSLVMILAALIIFVFFYFDAAGEKDVIKGEVLKKPGLDHQPARLEGIEQIVDPPVGTLEAGDSDTVVSGTVLNEEGFPVPQATVIASSYAVDAVRFESLWTDSSQKGPGYTERQDALLDFMGQTIKDLLKSRFRVVTGADGRFTFHGLEPGMWRIIARAEGTVPGMSRRFELFQEERAQKNLVLAQGVEIRGQVVDEGNNPVRGASVRARWALKQNLEEWKQLERPSYGQLLQGTLGSLPPDTVSAENGAFFFSAVTPGRYKFIALMRGYANSQVCYGTISESGRQHLRLVLQEGMAVKGVVKDASGEALAGCEITAVQEDATNAPFSVFATLLQPDTFFARQGTETGPEGRFTLKDLQEGTYTIVARREGFQTGIFQGIRASGAKEKPITIVLEPGKALQGTVNNSAGEPLPNVRITVTVAHPPPRTPVWPEFETITNGRGRFKFDALSSCRYMLRVNGDGYVDAYKWFEPKDGPLNVALVPGAVLKGIVVSGGRPVSDARVMWFPGRGDRDRRSSQRQSRMPGIGFEQAKKKTATDAEGGFVLNDLDAGSGELKIEAAGYLDAAKTVAVEAGVVRNVSIQLEKAGRVHGTVVDEKGEPVADAKVRLAYIERYRARNFHRGRRSRDEEDGDMRTRVRFDGVPVFSDAKGAWSLFFPRAGDGIMVQVTHEQYLSARSEPFSVPDPRSDGPELELVLSRGSILQGTVEGPSGKPAGGILVQVQQDFYNRRNRGGSRGPEDGRPPFGFPTPFASKQAISDAGGAWMVSALEAGDYRVVVDQAGFAPYRAEVALAEAEKKAHAIALEAPSRIRGVVVDADGIPVKSAQVMVRGRGLWRHVFSDQDGMFVVDRLIPGPSYLLHIQASGFLTFNLKDIEAPREALTCTLTEPADAAGLVLEDESRAPVDRFRLSLFPEEEIDYRRPWPRTFRNDDGSFEFSGIPPGTYRLVVESLSFPPAEIPHLTFEAGGLYDGIEILLAEGLVVEGTVLLPDGKPASNAVVTAVPAEEFEAASSEDEGGAAQQDGRERSFRGRGGRWGREQFMRTGTGGTDEKGMFVLKGLAEGTYVLQARHEKRHPSKPVSVTLPRTAEEAVILKLGDEKQSPNGNRR